MQKVRVYWNLHKKCWSVQLCKTNKVIAHKIHLVLETAQPIVRMGGQARVRDELKKNVHAFAVGYLMDSKQKSYHDWDRVKYNPYTDDYFMHKGEDHDEWNEIPKEFVGIIHMESLVHPNGTSPRVYI